MTPEEQAEVDRVTSALTGRLEVGSRVKAPNGLTGRVVDIRDGTFCQWVRVRFDGDGGHWEYVDYMLELV